MLRQSPAPIYLAVLGLCAALSVWFRGPCFGPIMLLFVALPALIATWTMRKTPAPPYAAWTVGLVAAAVSAWLLIGPLTTKQIFERHLGLPLPGDARVLKKVDERWGIDPGYYMHLTMSPESVDRIVRAAGLQPAEQVPWHACNALGLDWQKYEHAESYERTSGAWWVRLSHDAERGEVILAVYTL